MTLYQFNALPEDKQLLYVWDCSLHLLSRSVGRSYLNLYAVDGFYVEVRYDARHNQITTCRSFKSTLALEPYLALIDVQRLLA
jgi:hypothetical protein